MSDLLDGVDLSVSHEVERVRRGVAMLGRKQPALDREEALKLLEALIGALPGDS